MAEVIEEMRERLLPEYEQMKKHDICSMEKIRECMKKRTYYQGKLTQGKKELRFYADFIIFEKKVHKWVCEKEKVLHKNLVGLKSAIAGRIKRLYSESVQYFPHEERLWLNYLGFCKKSVPNEVARIYEKMLNFHGDKPKIWCETALWIYEFSQRMDIVRDTFYRGLARHPNSELLYNAFFGILLLDASKMSAECKFENDTLSEQDIALERLDVLYRSSVENIKDLSFFLGLLECCEKAEYAAMTAKLQKKILDDLMEKFSRDERLWEMLAQRELRGFNMVDLINMHNESVENEVKSEDAVEEKEETKKTVWKVRGLSWRIELCCKVYQEAVSALPTREMFRLYINAMLRLNDDGDEQAALKRKCLANAFRQAHESRLMSVEHYEAFTRMLLEYDDKGSGAQRAASLLEEAIENDKSPEMYEIWLSINMHVDDEAKVYAIYCKAKRDLGIKGALPVVSMILQYYKTHCDKYQERLQSLFRDICAQLLPEYAEFRAEYLEFLAKNFSLEEARSKYDEMCKTPPPCLAIHKKMAELEMAKASKNERDIKRLRAVHEMATYYFGKDNPQVWLDYIKFERECGEYRLVSMLHKRAVASLKNDFVDDFILEFDRKD